MSESDSNSRKRPNILITGTPGVGKTVTAQLLAERTGMKHVNVGEIIKDIKCYDGRDEELDTMILDEDKLLDHLELVLEEQAASEDNNMGIVADYHSCELFPERWFDLVLVLQTSTEVLYDRLTKRGYSSRKRDENMTCEIMQVLLEEAREAYDPNIVHAVPSNTLQDIESNVTRVQQWIADWIANHNDDDNDDS